MDARRAGRSTRSRGAQKPRCLEFDAVSLCRPQRTQLICVSQSFMPKDRIAIIGIGCRFPGGINDVESFWKLLIEGREALSDVPKDRWNLERYFDAEPGLPGKAVARRAGFL